MTIAAWALTTLWKQDATLGSSGNDTTFTVICFNVTVCSCHGVRNKNHLTVYVLWANRCQRAVCVQALDCSHLAFPISASHC